MTSLGGDPPRDLFDDKMETRLFQRAPVSGVHIADVFDARLFYVLGGHCPALGDASVSGSMAFGAQRDEVVRLVVSTFSARDDMVICRYCVLSQSAQR